LRALNSQKYFNRMANCSDCLLVARTVLRNRPASELAAHVFRRWVRGGKPAAAAVGFSAFSVTYEYVLAMTSVHSTFGNLGYKQMNFLPILQLGALTG
jgi:hypothetical protein